MGCGGAENKCVEGADLAGVKLGRDSKNFGYFGVGTVGRGRDGQITTDSSTVFTEYQLLFCCSNS